MFESRVHLDKQHHLLPAAALCSTLAKASASLCLSYVDVVIHVSTFWESIASLTLVFVAGFVVAPVSLRMSSSLYGASSGRVRVLLCVMVKCVAWTP